MKGKRRKEKQNNCQVGDERERKIVANLNLNVALLALRIDDFPF